MPFGVIRALPFAIGTFALLLSWFSWGFGSPPAYSLFSRRISVVVASSRIEQARASSSRWRYRPVIDVVREGASGGPPERLHGLMPAFDPSGKSAAEAAVARYPQGTIVQVRVVGDRLHADRTELFHLAHALFLTVLGIAFIIPGTLLLLPAGAIARILRRKGR
jgi:hypothetical protein